MKAYGVIAAKKKRIKTKFFSQLRVLHFIHLRIIKISSVSSAHVRFSLSRYYLDFSLCSSPTAASRDKRHSLQSDISFARSRISFVSNIHAFTSLDTHTHTPSTEFTIRVISYSVECVSLREKGRISFSRVRIKRQDEGEEKKKNEERREYFSADEEEGSSEKSYVGKTLPPRCVCSLLYYFTREMHLCALIDKKNVERQKQASSFFLSLHCNKNC